MVYNQNKLRELGRMAANPEGYRDGKVPLSTIISLVRSWIARFEQEYLKNQRYFDPNPRELVNISNFRKNLIPEMIKH